MERPLYKVLASTLIARQNCEKTNNTEWRDKHEERIKQLVKEYMPSGSGFDSGTELDINASTPDRLKFYTAVHHMDENGMYSGWTEHVVRVSPSLAFEIDITISGKNQDDIKEYIYECFQIALTQLVGE